MESRRGPGRPRKTGAERAAERHTILAAARITLHELGPDASLDDMAARAGVSKPTIYAHFADKAGLAEALTEELAAELDDLVSRPIDVASEEDPLVLLREGVERFIDFVFEETNVYRFVVRGIRGSEGEVSDSILVRAMQERVDLRLGQVFPDMSADGRFVASYGLLGLVFAAGEGWLHHGRTNRDRLIDLLVDLFVGGVAAISGAPTMSVPAGTITT